MKKLLLVLCLAFPLFSLAQTEIKQDTIVDTDTTENDNYQDWEWAYPPDPVKPYYKSQSTERPINNPFKIGFVSSVSSAPFGIHFSFDTEEKFGLYVEAKFSPKLFNRKLVTFPGSGYKDFKDWNDMIFNAGIQFHITPEIYFYMGGGVNAGQMYSMGLPADDGSYTWAPRDENVVHPNINTGLKLIINNVFFLLGTDVSIIDQSEYNFGYSWGHNQNPYKYSLNLGIGYCF